MKKITNVERRVHPRIQHRLPLSLMVNGYDFSTSTSDVSCIGTYCHIAKYIPPFTKLMVKLSLPILGDRDNRHCDVECKGVVVRTEDAGSGGFNIAIFFNEINSIQRSKISQYVNQFLPQQSLSQ